jgi:hypothetical protein
MSPLIVLLGRHTMEWFLMGFAYCTDAIIRDAPIHCIYS